MALLFNTTDCGPSNPLQGLSKHFERDRGIQQDHFGTAAGPSRQTFRSPSSISSENHDAAAQFFSPKSNPVSQLHASSLFNLSALNEHLPAVQPKDQMLSSAWANDFLLHSSVPTVSSTSTLNVASTAGQESTGQQRSWNASFMANNMSVAPFFAMAPQAMQLATHHDNVNWEKEFESRQVLARADDQLSIQAPSPEADELARTAGLLLETVKDEQNPKFKNSAFMGLMKQLRDREVVVEGNQMVENTQSSLDIKGKAKVVESFVPLAPTAYGHAITSAVRQHLGVANDTAQLDGEDEFWKQENADYINYWSESQRPQPAEDSSWHTLQDDWDRFEATSAGIRPLDQYQFQINNPYLLGDSSRTRNHSIHDTRLSFSESVLELEAAVQRNMTDAKAWFELGVKQQENEREKKALQALHRAVQLDSSHLASWLALAVSYTNDGNRLETYHAIREWAQRNEKYRLIVERYPEDNEANYSQKLGRLVECLIDMARSNTAAQLDADVQIALAVLFNVNEDYSKAQDCFRAALAVRPQDWLLYNRVGATMANSGQPEQAVQYYLQALDLNPVYIRARYNLGIACTNLRQYDEAAQHILNALILQDSDGVQDVSGLTSVALWDSLKTACIHMQRADLSSICDTKDVEQFQKAFNRSVM